MTGFPDHEYRYLDDDPLGMARGVLVALLAGGMFSLGLFIGAVWL